MTRAKIQEALEVAEGTGWAIKKVYMKRKGIKLHVGFAAVRGEDRVEATSMQGLVENIKSFNIQKMLNDTKLP